LGAVEVTRFLLIRHANHDAIGRYLAGQRAGLALNDSGRAQVEALVSTLRDVPLDAVASSPLERTMQTAEPIARDHGLSVCAMPDLLEFDVGEWTGRTFAELDPTPEWRRFNAVRSLAQAPGGETMLGVQQRAVRALFDLRRRHAAGTVAAVFHGDVIRAALLYFLGMPIDFFERIEISPARVSVVDLGDEHVRVLQVNGDSVPSGG
jgi:probable phosphoglycerate mutase